MNSGVPNDSTDTERTEAAEQSSSESLTPPPSLPTAIISYLHTFSDQELRAISDYALALANEDGHDSSEFTVSDPENVTKEEIHEYLLRVYGKTERDAPPKAVPTIKPINGLDYFYWQWHETETDEGENPKKSVYICPVSETPFDSEAIDLSSE